MKLPALLSLLLLASAALASHAGPAAAQEVPRLSRYGDQGTSHLGLALGFGAGGGGTRYLGGFNYGYFVADGVAPGVELELSGGSGLLTTGLTLATLRLVPLRTESLSLFLIGRAGRVFVSDHEDGWGAGGGAGVIFFAGSRVGFQLAYDVLALFPERFCGDLSTCRLQGLSVGLVAGF